MSMRIANATDDRLHLDRTHSPNAKAKVEAKAEAKAKSKAKADDPHPQDDAQYYMTDKQWEDVQDKIDNAGKKHYALNTKEWRDNELKCSLAIWDVIFPAAQFPSLSKPTSPCTCPASIHTHGLDHCPHRLTNDMQSIRTIQSV